MFLNKIFGINEINKREQEKKINKNCIQIQKQKKRKIITTKKFLHLMCQGN